jgi:outer membrane protein OmpA-like peptidoglycan-associated protein
MKTGLGILKKIAPIILTLMLAMSYQPVEAQIVKKLKKKATKAAEDAVVKKTAEKVGKETERAMDSVLNKGDKSKGPGEVEKKENPNDGEETSTDESNTSAVASPWSKYNFVPGDKIIFHDNLVDEESGEFPSRWDLMKGSAENASFSDEMIINLDNKSIIMPLMDSNDYLPEVFTVEFDAYFNEVIKANYYQQYDIRLWDGTGSNHVDGNVYDPIKIFRHRIRFRTIKNGKPNELGGEDGTLDDKDPNWRHIAIAFNKRSLKIFIDQYRVLNMPNLGFKPKMFSLGGNSDQSTNDIIAIKNIRIAEGGKKLYDRVMADGKFVTRGILFDVNNATIKPESMGVLNKVAEMMQKHPDLNFSIEGHTDSDGADDYNQSLSEERATSVKEALISLGIEKNRMQIKGLGESVPVSDNDSPEGKANNRRVEFIKI